MTDLVERLSAVAEHDWRVSRLAHTSDTAREAAAEIIRLRGLLSCAGIGLSLACEGAIPVNLLKQLWIDPHGLRADIAHCLGGDPLKEPK